MAKYTHTANPRVTQIFDDLEMYLEFCREYGYKYDEATLYDMRNHVYRQFNRYRENKAVTSRWEEDAKALMNE